MNPDLNIIKTKIINQYNNIDENVLDDALQRFQGIPIKIVTIHQGDLVQSFLIILHFLLDMVFVIFYKFRLYFHLKTG